MEKNLKLLWSIVLGYILLVVTGVALGGTIKDEMITSAVIMLIIVVFTTTILETYVYLKNKKK